MNNKKSIKYFQLFFCFVAISIVIFSSNTVSKAQNNTILLEGTKWVDETPFVNADGSAQAFLIFGTEQKVIYRIVGITGGIGYKLGVDQDKLLFYGSYDLKMNLVPPAIAIIDKNGEYTQNGNKVIVELPDRIVKITIKDNNRLSGDVFFKVKDRTNGPMKDMLIVKNTDGK